MKRCVMCGQDKPLADFHLMVSAPDGRQYRCKPCAREDARRWYAQNKARVMGLQATRGNNRYAVRPEQFRAQQAVRRAIRTGRLMKPDACEECGTSGRVEAAHFTYDQPFRVRWLCRSCHSMWDHAEPKGRRTF